MSIFVETMVWFLGICAFCVGVVLVRSLVWAVVNWFHEKSRKEQP